MDLVSMVVEIMEIIFLTYFEIESTVMGFHLYRSNWEILFNYFFKTDLLIICHAKITGKAVNLGDNKGMRMRIPCQLQFTGNCKMMNILQELICKL